MSRSARVPARRRRLVRTAAAALLGVLLVAGAVTATLWFAPFLRVSHVEYRTDPARQTALQESAWVQQGQPMVEVDTRAGETAAMATNLFSRVSVSRSWPSTIVVEATPRTPVVAVTGGGSGGYRLVDAQGVAFDTVTSAPVGIPAATVARGVDAPVLRTLATVTTGLSPELLATMKNLSVDDRGRVTMDIDNVAVTWGDSSETRLKAAVVRDLVSRAHVARVDVSAPMAPVTSANRDPGASATIGPDGSPTSPTGSPSASSDGTGTSTGIGPDDGTSTGGAGAGTTERPAMSRTATQGTATGTFSGEGRGSTTPSSTAASTPGATSTDASTP